MTKAFRKVLTLALATFWSCTSVSAADMSSIGQIKTLSGEVNLERAGKVSPVKLGDRLYQSDILRSGPDGATGVLFIDDARMAIGPNSELDLSKYQFNDIKDQGAAEMQLNSGSFAAITGKMVDREPGSLKLRTSASVIAVQGASFIVNVGATPE